MSIAIHLVSAVLVFIFSGLLAMAGIGAAFLTIIWAECGEVAVGRYARVKRGRVVCIPCAGQS